MPNTKAVGVAYADPEFESVTVSGAIVATGALVANGGVVASTIETTGDEVAANLNAGVYILSTAITANTTTTSAPVGSLGITTNATGRGKLFYADGTKWQFMAIS
jgi:hypothetical protein